MAIAEEEKKREAHPTISGDSPNGKIESQEEDESRIELLKWYLRMALESEDDPKIEK